MRLAITGETGFLRLASGSKVEQLPPGLIAWWPADGDTKDVVGGHDCLLRGDATFAEGLVGQAFSLDGDSDFVEVPDAPELNFGTGDFTVALWVRFNRFEHAQVIIEKLIHGDVPLPGWGLTWLGERRLSFLLFGAPGVASEPSVVPVGTWIHLAVRRSGNVLSISRDGAPLASGDGPMEWNVNSPCSLKIGHRGNPNDTPSSESWQELYPDGQVDEVMLFNRALSDAEIEAIYEAGLVAVGAGSR